MKNKIIAVLASMIIALSPVSTINAQSSAGTAASGMSVGTAVAIGVARKMSLEGNIVVLATAHPSKFSDVVMKETNIKPELPENLKNILVEKEKYEKLPKDLKKIQNYILERI